MKSLTSPAALFASVCLTMALSNRADAVIYSAQERPDGSWYFEVGGSGWSWKSRAAGQFGWTSGNPSTIEGASTVSVGRNVIFSHVGRAGDFLDGFDQNPLAISLVDYGVAIGGTGHTNTSPEIGNFSLIDTGNDGDWDVVIEYDITGAIIGGYYESSGDGLDTPRFPTGNQFAGIKAQSIPGPVPEPSSAILLLLGAATTLSRRNRR